MNYILIYPDELRAESLACYGHPLVKTPNIDALAAEGTLFENNYSVHPVCVASRCSLVTGWYPHVRGYRSQQNLMEAEEDNYITYLNRAGFTTALCGKDDCFDAESTKKVFAEHLPLPEAERPVMDGKKHYTMLMPPIPDEKESTTIDACCAENASEFIRRHAKDKNPFFLWVNFLYPHPPYGAPESYYNMYDPKEVPMKRGKEWIKEKPSTYGFCQSFREADEESPEIFRKINAVYLGMISYVDMLTGKIMDTLKKEGIYEDTTIIFCSDHGDFAGESRLVEKCPNGLDDMLVKVPLIIRRPGCKMGHRVSELTQSIDIMPTIFDFEQLTQDYDQFGVSLKEQVEGAPGDVGRIVYAEGGYDTREPQCFETLGPKDSLKRKFMGEGSVYYPKMMHQEKEPESVCRAVMRRDSRYKIIIRTNGEHELYDMLQDPLESKNLYQREECSELFSGLAMKTLLWMIHTSDVVPHKEVEPWFAVKKGK